MQGVGNHFKYRGKILLTTLFKKNSYIVAKNALDSTQLGPL